MAERSIAAVLKTVEGNTSGGSNPSLSANQMNGPGFAWAFLFGAPHPGIAEGNPSLIRSEFTLEDFLLRQGNSIY